MSENPRDPPVMPEPQTAPRPRPFIPAQAVQNAAFLAALKRTGNVCAAAREIGCNREMFVKRRARHPAFAAEWDAAVAFAHARITALRTSPPPGRGSRLVRTRSGRVQLRRTAPARLTRDAEQAFLTALSATANICLLAAAGFSTAIFYHRAHGHAGFAREMRLARETGYRRLEEALLESTLVESHHDDGWRHNDPPPIPPMTAAQALHLLNLHHKEVTGGIPEPLRRRHGETGDVQALRLQFLFEHRLEREREQFRIIEAARTGGTGPEAGEKPPVLPALDQVAGWSKSSGKPPRDAELFGGWRKDG